MATRTHPVAGSSEPSPGVSRIAQLRMLVGSGDRIMQFAALFAIAGVALNVAYPAWLLQRSDGMRNG